MPRIAFGNPLGGGKKAGKGGSDRPSEGKSPARTPTEPAGKRSSEGRGKPPPQAKSHRRASPEAVAGPTEEELRETRLIEAVARAADTEGMYAQQLIGFPDLLQRHGLDPTAVTHGLAHRADQLNRQLTNQLLDRYNKKQRKYQDA